MASTIPGYEYDIFISYRQKDNKGDRWVSEFVEALRTELEATFKDEVGVYFDINPHDGLLESHIVDASLKEKLKCLVFIPVISQTYCDPKSFAWQHEFVAFNTMAKEDQFGRDIRLAGGNVAGRILPVKIHDLEQEDKELLENELGMVLRGIEFIYREAGVNRPLKPGDDPKENLNRTNYRNQVNKVANAIKEIITALRKFDQKDDEKSQRVAASKPEPQKSLKPKIILASAVALTLIVLGYFLITKLFSSSRPVERSIAVLPFINDSPDQENTYFINGIMEEVLSNLQKIKDCRVLSRTSTDQYRGVTRPTIPEIAKKLNVNFIVEGSGQKYGNKFVLRVQLIAADNERHIWGESFEREIRETSDIIGIQSQVAQSIAAKLKATITPEEKKLIEKTPTTNLTAYDFYQRGRDELNYDGSDTNLIKKKVRKAKELFSKALVYDSTFALAYIGLADVYFITNNSSESYYSQNYLDSMLILAERALSYDDRLAEGYAYKAGYYFLNGKNEQGIKEIDKALEYNPTYGEGYNIKAWNVYLLEYTLDLVKGLECLHKVISLYQGNDKASRIRELGGIYGDWAGFPEKQKYYYNEALKLDGDTNAYLDALAQSESIYGNYEKALELYNRRYSRDTNNFNFGLLAGTYLALGQYKESLKYFKKIEKFFTAPTSDASTMRIIGYAYWQNGYKAEAEQWFNKQKNKDEESLKLGRSMSIFTNLNLAALYAFKGEREKAYEQLKAFNKIHVCIYAFIKVMKNEPMFNSIRNEPEFQKIVSELESKYQAEHERVKRWMEEQGKGEN